MTAFNDELRVQEDTSDEIVISLEMTPSKPAEKADLSEELVLTPSSSDEIPESNDLTLEAEKIVKVEEITFEGEEDAEERVKKAMMAYDKAMDQAAGINK